MKVGDKIQVRFRERGWVEMTITSVGEESFWCVEDSNPEEDYLLYKNRPLKDWEQQWGNYVEEFKTDGNGLAG